MSNREIFIDKLRQLSKEEMLERYVALLNTEKLTDYVSDLETKLAESEKKNFELVATINLKEHKPAFCTLADRDCEALGQVEELKQQLSEKEKEIEEWIAVRDDKNKVINKQTDKINKLKETLNQIFKDNRKAEISFAVELLENLQDRVEDKVNEYLYSHDMDNYDEFVTHQGMYCCFEIMVEIIDNQIKQLKEGK